MGKLLIAGAFSYCICSVEIAEGERTEDFYEENNGCVLPVLSGNDSRDRYDSSGDVSICYDDIW